MSVNERKLAEIAADKFAETFQSWNSEKDPERRKILGQRVALSIAAAANGQILPLLEYFEQDEKKP